MKKLVHTLDILGLQTFAKEANTLASHVEVCVCLCVSVSLCLCLSLSLSLSLYSTLASFFLPFRTRDTASSSLFFFVSSTFLSIFFYFLPFPSGRDAGSRVLFRIFFHSHSSSISVPSNSVNWSSGPHRA